MSTTTNTAILEDAANISDTEIRIAFRSVVAPSYKAEYAKRAAARKRKNPPTLAEKRGCGDWLQRKLAELTLTPELNLDIRAFEAILDLNGIRHDHWNRTTPGWQGRLRMTGRLSLQRRVAEDGVLHTETDDLIPPKAWCDRINGSRRS